MAIKVLVVEDNAKIRGLLRSMLTVEGFEVETAVSLSEARAVLEHRPPQLVILDLGLPDGDGGDLLPALRSDSTIPVLVVSAREDEAQKIALLDAGADDYLVKPFSVKELLARIRVALRHRGTALQPAQVTYALGDLVIDLEQRRVERRGAVVHLTPTEFQLLSRLVHKAGKVVMHRQLLTDVWGPEFAEHTHYLRIYMGNLRAKLEDDPAEPRYLLTEAGIGYRLAVE